eukprot:TRINITY_DN31791_c0_g1_i2.p1 TRINITY_DN31791_c0_g1~~TRINITY_DN31791_c0_g1_i2.p1  ORF type:complete len:389 (+),score=24.71 TRINITY_DN31791_c0_g1_i2:85-1251(+)
MKPALSCTFLASVYLLRHYCWRGPSYPVDAVEDSANSEADAVEDEDVVGNSANTEGRNYVGGFSLTRFLTLGAVAIVVVASAFGPLLGAAALAHGKSAAVEYLLQIKSRLFPFQRGLCHAYWAPNVWAAYNIVDKVLTMTFSKIPQLRSLVAASSKASMTGGLVEVASHAVLPNILPSYTFALTLLAMSPVLVQVWRRPEPKSFIHAAVYCQLCSFMLGYHVHEKAILMATVPLGLICTDTVVDARLYLLMSWIGHYSLFPLLFEPAEEPIKVCLYLGHLCLSYFCLRWYHNGRTASRGGGSTGLSFTSLEIIYLIGLVPLYVFTNVVHPRTFRQPDGSTRLPFLPLLLTSEYCTLGLVYTWWLCARRYFEKTHQVTACSSDAGKKTR